MTMRPKKPRYIDGIQLADNLYPDPKGRPGFYQYHRPDGTKRTLRADSVEMANTEAEIANGLRDQFKPEDPADKPLTRSQLAFHVPVYTRYREQINPQLLTKQSWKNRKYALQQFACRFDRLRDLEINQIRIWWDELTHSQQKLRLSEFRRFFNWLMGQGLVPAITFNPFTLADDVPRLLSREKPPKQRKPLTPAHYRDIYHKAAELDLPGLQIAMALSRYTTLRREDCCNLRFDEHLIGNTLQVIVAKSMAQKGSARAARFSWDLDEHPLLRKIINRARELSLINKRCPYLVSHMPKRKAWNSKAKKHICQVVPGRLSTMFAQARDACEISGTSFHEVRGLASTLLRQQGHTVKEIQQIMAHESISTTVGYIDPSDLPFEKVGLKVLDDGL
jgi:integrase